MVAVRVVEGEAVRKEVEGVSLVGRVAQKAVLDSHTQTPRQPKTCGHLLGERWSQKTLVELWRK